MYIWSTTNGRAQKFWDPHRVRMRQTEAGGDGVIWEGSCHLGAAAAGAVSLSTDAWQVPLLSAAVYCKCATSSGAGGWVAQTLWHLCTAIKAECLSCPTRVTRLLLKPFPTPKWGSQSTYAADDSSDDHDIFFTATIFRVEEGSCLMLLLVILVLVA